MANPNTESLIKVELTQREWNVIRILRQIRYGKMTIQKQAGLIVLMEPAPTIKVEENMNTNFPIGVE
jgi:hypothetical protein